MNAFNRNAAAVSAVASIANDLVAPLSRIIERDLEAVHGLNADSGSVTGVESEPQGLQYGVRIPGVGFLSNGAHGSARFGASAIHLPTLP